jgi:hypothetical protein
VCAIHPTTRSSQKPEKKAVAGVEFGGLTCLVCVGWCCLCCLSSETAKSQYGLCPFTLVLPADALQSRPFAHPQVGSPPLHPTTHALPPMTLERLVCVRWLVAGGARSGSALHTDPVGAAWNALLVGRKRWLMSPPPPAAAEALRLHEYDGDRQGMMSWLVDVLPTLEGPAEVGGVELELWEVRRNTAAAAETTTDCAGR